MTDHPFSVANAPYGPTASALDMLPVSAPSADVVLTSPCRGFVCLTSGDVSVVTQAGNTRTFTGFSGLFVPCCVSTILAATECDLLLFM